MTQVGKHSLAPRAAGGRRRAFTLVELMVSIALALLLILGINAVFKMSSETVGTGMQLNEMQRQIRTARNGFQNDFDHFADRATQPALIIESLNQPAFRDRNDELAAINAPKANFPPYDPTQNNTNNAQNSVLDVRDADGKSVYPLPGWSTYGITNANLSVALPQVINNRNHRVDLLSFFVRDPNGLQRQTPNYGNATMSSGTAQYQGFYRGTDAWVVYGHVLQPDNSVNAANLLTFNANPGPNGGPTHFLGLGVTRDPYQGQLYTSGATPIATNSNLTNPNNFYTSNWVLGRVATVLGEPSQLDNYIAPYTNTSATANPQTFATDPYNNKSTNYQYTGTAVQNRALRPVSWGTALNTTATTASGNQQVQIQWSQADVAGASMLTMYDKALHAQNPTDIAPGGYYDNWYMPLLTMGYGQTETPPNPPLPTVGAPTPSAWIWPQLATVPTPGGWQPWHAYRFQAQAWPDKLGANGAPVVTANTPAMQQQLAVQAPIFLRGCSQFIVEYAGDYLKQNFAPGVPTAGLPAGTVYQIGEDGQIDFDVISDASNNTVMKRIRWYGMTRSLDDGQSVENTGAVMPTVAGTAGSQPTNPQIVRPLYRYIQQYTQNGPTNAQGTLINNIVRMPFEKLVTVNPMPGGNNFSGFPDTRPQNVDSYTCAWGPCDMDLDKMTTVAPGNDPSLSALAPLLLKSSPNVAFPSRSLLPWMIRITIRLDDPSGRMPDGQTVQFIFNVPRPH